MVLQDYSQVVLDFDQVQNSDFQAGLENLVAGLGRSSARQEVETAENSEEIHQEEGRVVRLADSVAERRLVGREGTAFPSHPEEEDPCLDRLEEHRREEEACLEYVNGNEYLVS